MNITENQINTLKQYMPNIEELIREGDVQNVLNAIDDVIINDILGNNDEPTKQGIMLQKLYDEIFNQN